MNNVRTHTKKKKTLLKLYIYIFFVPLSYTGICEMYMERSLHIYIEHKKFEIRKTPNVFSVQVRNFLLPLSLKVFRHKEREAQSFYSGFFICPPPQSRAAPATRPRELAKVNRLVWCLVSTLLSSNSQNPLRASGAWRQSHSVTPFPISGYCDISEWHVCSARTRKHLC